ncbi:MAG: type II toxin-antitoxin system HicB family antitoxin [Syntrophobacteraceae bacterium]
MKLAVQLELETDGRWIVEVMEIPGVLAYGESSGHALARAKALTLRVIADRIEHGESAPDTDIISFEAA